jgi:hypothetical protein
MNVETWLEENPKWKLVSRRPYPQKYTDFRFSHLARIGPQQHGVITYDNELIIVEEI